jgi:hypothetical protein
MNKIGTLIIATTMAVAAPMLSQAQDTDGLTAHYAQMIQTGWPQASLRVDRQRWLAERAVDALQDCMSAGAEFAYCRQLVVDSLVELMGEDPVSTLSYARWEMRSDSN